MKKFWTFTGSLAVFVAVVALVGVTAVSAQGPVNPVPAPGTGQVGSGSGLGIMTVDEAEMHAALADALGMSVAEFEAAIANGETLATLALAQGVDLADLQAVMDAIHADAAAQAVADGLVTQEQVDWMQSRRGGQARQGGQAGQGGQGRMGGQGAAGTGMARGGQHGAGGNGGNCLYPTTP